MSVRPFYISADIEGRKTMLTGGPKKSDGYMHVEITQRNRGEIETAFNIRSFKEGDKLVTRVYDSSGACVATHETDY